MMLRTQRTRFAAESQPGTDIDYRTGAEVFAVARLLVVGFAAGMVAWVGGSAARWLTPVIASSLIFHIIWWWYYLRQNRGVTVRVAFVAALTDVVMVGVGCMFSGGVTSPAVLIWAVTLSIAGAWIGIRWTLPLVGVVVVFCAGMGLGPLDLGIDIGMTRVQLAVWDAAMLLLLMMHVAIGASMQRTHSRDLAAAEARARQDPLTGLANRTLLDERLTIEVERARREGSPLALAILDLDDFKLVNDTRGHIAGDEVLICVAKQIAAHTRAADTPVRLGGEEFVIVLPATDARAAIDVLDRMRTSVAASPNSWGTTFSAGLAMLRQGAETGPEMMALADAALYRAKRAGKNQTVVGDAAMAVGMRDRFDASELQGAADE